MYKGSNAEKLHNMCMYDLLCRMQENGHDLCVIEQITGAPQGERCEKYESGWVTQCRECIAEYLSERAT